MAQFETYIELPVLVEYDWTDEGPEITNIQLRSDGRTLFTEIDELPAVDLEKWLNKEEMDRIEQDIVEDAAKGEP